MNVIKSAGLTRVMIFYILLSSCSQSKPHTIPYYNTAAFTPEWISPSQAGYSRIHKVQDFKFLNQDSSWVTAADYDGHYYLANFFFTTCPSICPKMMDNIAKLAIEFKDNDKVKFISYTVTPWIDTVGQLKAYALDHNIKSPKWNLVTGETETIYTLARQSYFAEKELGLELNEDDFLHTENILLIDPKRRIRGIYSATRERDLQRIIEDMSILQSSP